MNFFYLKHDPLQSENTAEGYTVGMPKHVALINESDEGGEFLDEGLRMDEQPLKCLTQVFKINNLLKKAK